MLPETNQKQSSSGTSVKTQRYSETPLEGTERRPGTSGEIGAMYEKKLLMLGLFRALNAGYDFILDTNVQGFGSCDDVVFTYKESDGIEQKIYLQLKHKEDKMKKKKINYVDFLKYGKNADFGLYEHFNDYIDILRKLEEKDKIRNKYFIIYTNIDFSCPREDDKGLRIHKKTQNQYFRFKKLDVSEHKPLEIFSTTDSKIQEKYPNFYQFDQNDEEEKIRVIKVLKGEFETIYEKKKKLTVKDSKLESKIEDYLNTLIFAVDQLDQEMLGNQIKEEMKKEHSLSQEEVDYAFQHASDKIDQWKLRRGVVVPLTENDDFFRQGKEKHRAMYYTTKNEKKLASSKICFKKTKYEELFNFIFSGKKLWIISSKTSWLNRLVIYQALNEEKLKEKTGVNYASYDHHLFLTWRDLLVAYKDILPAFKTMEQSLLILQCDSTDPVNQQIVDGIVKITSDAENNSKQVIVIAPENYELSKQLNQKLNSSYDQENYIGFIHLTLESQENCLKTKKIRFQGNVELFSMEQLLVLEEQFPIPEKILRKLNFGMLELETLLRSSIVDIGNDKPRLSDLESAHFKTDTHIELRQLKCALEENLEDIFAFVGEENDVKSLLPTDSQQQLVHFEGWLTAINGRFILLKGGQEEEQFKQLCYQADQVEAAQKALHLLKKGNKQWIWPWTYSRDFYMQRNLYPLVVDEKKLQQYLIKDSRSLGFIVFSGTSEKTLLELLNIKSDTEDEKNVTVNTAIFEEEAAAQEKFNRLSNDLHQNVKSIHWLKVNEVEGQKQLHWYRSNGDVSRLRQVLVNEGERVKTPFEETSLAKSTERVVVLAGGPGMGKTTTLARMLELMKKEKPESWVMKYDLNKYQTVLASKKIKTVEDLVDLLTIIDGKLADPLTRRILMYQLTCPGQVTLLWDGFDKVKTERQDTVLALFEFLKKETAAAIWVTTRRNDQAKLEDRLSVLAYPFEALSTEKQIDFLSCFWAMKLKLACKNPHVFVLKSYANEIIQGFEQSIQRYQADNFFISIPLRARMVAEIYQEVVKKALIEKKPSSEIFEAAKLFSIGNFFRKFIDRNYDIYLHEKGLDEESKRSLTKRYDKAYGLLAIKQLFDLQETAHFISDKNEFPLNTLTRIGLIEEIEEPVSFIHRTLAEYFAGKWLAEKAKKLEVKKFLVYLLFEREYGIVRRFIYHVITQNLECDVIAFQEYCLKTLMLS